jgi:acetyl-CoA C-acetyltransferase
MAGNVIIAGARTPIGKLSGSLSSLSAVELAAVAISEALSRASLDPSRVDSVIMGHVLQAGQGQGTARQAAERAGIPLEVPAMTVNKVCLSGIQAIHLADLIINAGEADVVVAGGMESMSRAPYLLPHARAGYRFGHGQLVDAIEVDGLTCAFDQLVMGQACDRDAREAGISRERQDEIAEASHARAGAASARGRLEKEIAPVAFAQKRGDPRVVRADEGVRSDTTRAALANLRPAFSPEGTVTAGNASQLSDGAAALVVASPSFAERHGIMPLAEIVGYGQVAGPDPSLLTKPSRAIRKALERAGMRLGQVDLFEINEAFAAVAAASIDDLGISMDVVNPNGGAIALGHPLGMSGARLVLSLAIELADRSDALGAAALCGGGGQGDAMLLRSLR